MRTHPEQFPRHKKRPRLRRRPGFSGVVLLSLERTKLKMGGQVCPLAISPYGDGIVRGIRAQFSHHPMAQSRYSTLPAEEWLSAHIQHNVANMQSG